MSSHVEVYIPSEGTGKNECRGRACQITMSAIPRGRSVRVNRTWYDARALENWFASAGAAIVPHTRRVLSTANHNRIRARSRDADIRLVRAVIARDARAVRALLVAGADANAKDRGMPMLELAASVGAPLAIMKLLLDAGAEVNALGSTFGGETALVKAVSVGAPLDVIRLLLDRGADPNIESNFDDYTPLMKAVSVGAPFAVVELLLKKGAHANYIDDTFGGMFHAAARSTEREGPDAAKVYALLAEKGASFAQKDRGGATALHAAANDAVMGFVPKPVLVQTLLDLGVNAKAKDLSGFTARNYARIWSKEHILEGPGARALLMSS